jgi:osmotically-inducible protein OsmY
MKPLILYFAMACSLVACSKDDTYAKELSNSETIPAPAGQSVDVDLQNRQRDAELAEQVRQIIQDDGTLASNASTVSVTVENGIVTLFGDVDSEEQRQMLIDKVRGMSGVVGVVDQLRSKAQ